jgi:hypothetical protein
MKPLKTKAQVRAEIEQAMASYMAEGGEIKSVPRGLSGNPNNVNIFAQGFNGRTAEPRTLLVDTVKTIEARKHSGKPKNIRPKRKLLKDDFGEPLRWVWED